MNRRVVLAGLAVVPAYPLNASAAPTPAALRTIASAASGTLGVYARRLDGTPPIAYNPDESFPSASVIKVLILVALFQYSERYPDVFERRIRLKASDFVDGSEVLASYPVGTEVEVGDLAHAMIERSDNSASNVLIDFLGMHAIAQTARRAGLANTQLKRHFMDPNAIAHHSDNRTTPRDMARLLYLIEKGQREGIHTVASPRACRKMIEILLRQEDRDKIARGLPKGLPIANKTGEIDGVRNDVAIVDPFGDRPYIIAVLTKNLLDFSLGNIAIRRTAAVVHRAFG